MPAVRRRLDVELVRRGLAASRERAGEQIAAGQVLVGGSQADKASRLVAADEPVTLAGPGPRFVSRAGDKLDAALEQFGVPVEGRQALDAGASTGGFTDCLLTRGAATVVAVDVGRGQLDLRLRSDPRVRVVEGVNVRSLDLPALGRADPFDLVVADLSFISLRTVAPALLGLAGPGADLVLLVKPQFEVGRADASRGRGVISDPALRARALEEVVAHYVAAGARHLGTMESPVRGAAGNVELLVHLVR